MRRLAFFLLVVTAVTGIAAGVSAAQSPVALRAKILAAAKAQHSVHWVQTNVIGNALITFTTDTGATAGSQRGTIKVGKTTGRLTILVVGATAYVQGDSDGLQLLVGLTRTQSTQYAGRWISIPKGDKDYAGIAAAVTMPSLVQLLTPHGHLTAFAANVHGKRVVGVRATFGKGKKKTAEVLDAPAKGKPLPIEEDSFTPGMESITRLVLSKWNETVNVTAPASSTPIATVRQG